VRIALVSAVVFVAAVSGAATPDGNVFESPLPPAIESPLDRIVFAQLTKLNARPALCSDAVFVRRAFLDVLGSLPTEQEARDFIQDPDTANKRQTLVDRLLQREEFADYWSMKWGDILRIKAEFPVNLWPNAAQAYHRWIRSAIARNQPYDEFVRQILTSSGSNFRVGSVNFYRAVQNRTPDGVARAVALTFMGARAENWPPERLAGMTGFFSQIGYKPTSEWKEEHVFWDPLGSSSVPGNTAPGRAAVADIGQGPNLGPGASAAAGIKPRPAEGVFPDGTTVMLPPGRDPRELFADWLVTPQNPWFTRCIANRIWAWLLGRGIIHEPDDIREDNPPENPELLAYLEKELVAGHYDLKRVFRLILTSQTYQLSPSSWPDLPQCRTSFARYSVRRLDAEVLSDAINKVTGGSDLYTSPIPEPFTYIPRGMPAIAIADGSISSPFLALFGRSARATGLESERNNNPTPAQWLYLLNSADVQRKLEQGTNLQAVIGFSRKPSTRIVEDLYLTILSRFPTPEEIKVVEAYGKPPLPKRAAANRQVGTNTAAATPAPGQASGAALTNAPADDPAGRPARKGPLGSLGKPSGQPSRLASAKRREDWIDVAWALINSDEFLYRH
jgi:hypothetical protein